MVKQIHVRAAAPIGDRIVDPVMINISGYILDPTNKAQAFEVKEKFKEDAELLFYGLRSLPGGTFDQLLILMLQHTASSFIVAHDFDKAHLRAAAPDLLEACKDAVIAIEAETLTVESVRKAITARLNAAIAKAQGESEVTNG